MVSGMIPQNFADAFERIAFTSTICLHSKSSLWDWRDYFFLGKGISIDTSRLYSL